MKKAFTFMEVMIAMAIIGFITTMVLPIFFNTYGKKVVSAQLKKTCTQIINAAKHVMTDERSNDMESLTSDFESDAGKGFYYTSAGVKTSNAEQGAQYFLEKYFKHTSSNCGSGGTSDCVAPTYRTPDEIELGPIPNDFYCIKTVNDSAVCMRFKEGRNKMEVLVDVNGSDKPNITGSDVYVMWITDDGQLRDIEEYEANCNKASGIDDDLIVRYAAGCFHKIVLKSWNMREE